MIKLISILLLVAPLMARADFVFTWTNCPNKLVGSPTYLWQGTQSSHYTKRYMTSSNSITLKGDDFLHYGFNYFACQQEATNSAGAVGMTDFSGEIQVIKRPVAELEIPIMTSTNLGQSWVLATNQTVTFPTGDAQRYFRAAQMRANHKAQVILPPSP